MPQKPETANFNSASASLHKFTMIEEPKDEAKQHIYTAVKITE